MIAGNVVTPISEVTGTRSCSVYPILIGELVYNVYDTPGLDALGLGTDPVTKLIRDMHDGVDLLVFCLQGRITEDTVAIYKHFSWPLLVNVPVIAVITGLEHEDPMQSWWTKNQAAFKRHGMSFADCACVTTLRGKGSIFAIQYEESMNTVRAMIATRCLPKGQREAITPSPIPTHIQQKRWKHYIPAFIITVFIVAILIVVTVKETREHQQNQ